MTKRLCTFSGCKNVVDHADNGTSPRCPKHPVKARPRPKAEYCQDEKGRRIYDTTRWRKLSKLKRKNDPLCERCLLFGIATSAREVDHIIELEDNGDPWNYDNLQSLCSRCHRVKTAEAKKRREKGKGSTGGFFV